MKKIAPRLQTFLLTPGNAFDAHGWVEHKAELRALLAVARAARRHVREDSSPLATGGELAAWDALVRALARLDKVSGGRTKP